ncbi:MAG: PglZ domain-containing protein [Bacilli bacterium]|nr:PglZ domain-containing protein [Bacilli bacterium]
MNRWVQTIIEKVTPSTVKPIIVIDHQRYLEIGEIQELLRKNGYTLVFVDCGILVRIKYELEVKGKENTILVIKGNYSLVDDMSASAFVIDLKSKEVFNNFDEKAIIGLSYNALSTIDSIQIYEELSYEDTIRFLLENLYGIDVYAWQHNKSKERCLAILISVYTNQEQPNQAITDFLKSLGKPYFGDRIIKYVNSGCLFDFISKLRSDEINFENPMLAKELANLKMKGLLENGVSIYQTNDLQNLSQELFEYLIERIKLVGDQYKDWFEIAPKLGELGYVVYELQNKDLIIQYCELVTNINNRFQVFLENHYESLFSLSGLRQPITIDKVQDYISATTKNSRIAFIVIDGMNYWQWVILKHQLEKMSLEIDEKSTLTWIPSITAWARQAIFAGKKPDITADNRGEGELFKKYWMEKNKKLSYHQIAYEVVKTGQKLRVPTADIIVAGFVTNGLDDLMHGIILGYEQLFINTKLWIEKSEICDSIKELRDAGFEVYISTDHGNIEAELKLKLSAGQKTLAHSKSKRFILFDTEEQALTYVQNNTNYKLGRKNRFVYFQDDNGFGSTNEKVITHGGSHILEMLIPIGRVK